MTELDAAALARLRERVRQVARVQAQYTAGTLSAWYCDDVTALLDLAERTAQAEAALREVRNGNSIVELVRGLVETQQQLAQAEAERDDMKGVLGRSELNADFWMAEAQRDREIRKAVERHLAQARAALAAQEPVVTAAIAYTAAPADLEVRLLRRLRHAVDQYGAALAGEEASDADA